MSVTLIVAVMVLVGFLCMLVGLWWANRGSDADSVTRDMIEREITGPVPLQGDHTRLSESKSHSEPESR